MNSRRRHMRVRIALFVTVAIVAASVAPPAAQQSPPQTFRSGRDVLTIEASVTGPGDAPLIDLKAEDFTVKVDGQVRPVVTLHRFGATASSTGSDAPVGRFVRAADLPP